MEMYLQMVDMGLVRRTTDRAICYSTGYGADKRKKKKKLEKQRKKERRGEFEWETAWSRECTVMKISWLCPLVHLVRIFWRCGETRRHSAVLAVSGNRQHNSVWLRIRQSWRNAKIKVEFVNIALMGYCAAKIWFAQYRLISDGGWHWRRCWTPVTLTRLRVMTIFFPYLCTKPWQCLKKWRMYY